MGMHPMPRLNSLPHFPAPILQTDPRQNYLTHQEEIDQAIARVMASGRYILGAETTAFEQEFASYIGVQYAVGVGSGTDALVVALRSLGIGPGDAVATASFTAVATVAAIELYGALPVFIDIDPTTYTIDPDQLESVIRAWNIKKNDPTHPKLKVVLPVHLYGLPSDNVAILEIARRYGLQVIEDCAQAHGASLNGHKAGTSGDLAAFSFYPTKNLGAHGDGGIIITNDPRLAEKARLIRQYGWRERYVSELPGLNSRLDEVQAAI